MGHAMPGGEPMPDLLTPEEVASVLRLTTIGDGRNLRRSLDHLCETGRLVGFVVGGTRMFRKLDVLRFIYYGNSHRRSEPAARPIREN